MGNIAFILMVGLVAWIIAKIRAFFAERNADFVHTTSRATAREDRRHNRRVQSGIDRAKRTPAFVIILAIALILMQILHG